MSEESVLEVDVLKAEKMVECKDLSDTDKASFVMARLLRPYSINGQLAKQ